MSELAVAQLHSNPFSSSLCLLPEGIYVHRAKLLAQEPFRHQPGSQNYCNFILLLLRISTIIGIMRLLLCLGYTLR